MYDPEAEEKKRKANETPIEPTGKTLEQKVNDLRKAGLMTVLLALFGIVVGINAYQNVEALKRRLSEERRPHTHLTDWTIPRPLAEATPASAMSVKKVTSMLGGRWYTSSDGHTKRQDAIVFAADSTWCFLQLSDTDISFYFVEGSTRNSELVECEWRSGPPTSGAALSCCKP